MKKIKINLQKFNKLYKRLINRWIKNYDIFVIALFLLVALLGIYLIYDKIYSSGWSEEKKEEYLKTKRKEVLFREADFDRIIETIKERNDRFNKKIESSKDIFK